MTPTMTVTMTPTQTGTPTPTPTPTLPSASCYSAGTGYNLGVISILQLSGETGYIPAGNFTTYKGVTTNRINRVDFNGNVDGSFNVGVAYNSTLFTNSIDSTGKIYVGGSFTTYSGVSQNRINKLNSDGTKDTSFTIGTGFNALVRKTLTTPDDKVLVGGQFTEYSGSTVRQITRLNSDGSLDLTFSGLTAMTGPTNFAVSDILIDNDGKYLVSGSFSACNSTVVGRIVRLNTDGSLDLTFSGGGTRYNAVVNSIALQSDGKIMVGGDYNQFNGAGRNRLSRLNTDGSLDTSWTSTVNNNISRLIVDNNDKVLAIGAFTLRISRWNANGTIDSSFNVGTGFNGFVDNGDIKHESTGNYLIGTSGPTTYNSTSYNNIFRVQTDGTFFNC